MRADGQILYQFKARCIDDGNRRGVCSICTAMSDVEYFMRVVVHHVVCVFRQADSLRNLQRRSLKDIKLSFAAICHEQSSCFSNPCQTMRLAESRQALNA